MDQMALWFFLDDSEDLSYKLLTPLGRLNQLASVGEEIEVAQATYPKNIVVIDESYKGNIVQVVNHPKEFRC